MQYKKEILKIIIMEKAEKEMLLKGYEQSSLRSIAKAAGTTIGNLYHYFDNKEALFDELVKKEYTAFLYLIGHHMESEIPKDIDIKDEMQVWRLVLSEYLKRIMPVFTKRFLLMLEMSRGTRYENVKDEFISVLEKHFYEHMESTGNNCPPGFARVIAEQLIHSILYIIRHYEEDDIKHQLLCDTILLNIAGMMSLMK